MQSTLAWTLLSREAVHRAGLALVDEAQGVRDEIGFLELHQGYADRFFPGTSVLHTRLRYALFVPWMYQEIAAGPQHRRVDDLVVHKEIELAGRLKEQAGAIGGRTYPKPTAQPASMVYWTALRTWGLLRRAWDGSLPSRAAVHRAIRHQRSGPAHKDDDHQLLEEVHTIFVNLPSPPKEWNDHNKPLDFRLTKSEASFLRAHLIGVQRPPLNSADLASAPSLLSRLVENCTPLKDVPVPWDEAVLEIADEADRAALIRARKVAALSAIGRALYAALVEELRGADGLSTEYRHRESVQDVIAQYRQEALQVNLEEVQADMPYLSAGLLQALAETQRWLSKRSRQPAELHRLYAAQEQKRKGHRARLVMTLAGKGRRAEWMTDEHPNAEPLHYRWGNVRRLLLDLEDC